MADRNRAGIANARATAETVPPDHPRLSIRLHPTERNEMSTETLAQRAQGRIVVITGGAQGIGLAIGERFAAEGATIVVGDLNPETGRASASRLGGSFIELDVTVTAAVTAAAKEIFEQYGRIDVLVNNAGTAHETDAIEVPISCGTTSSMSTSRACSWRLGSSPGSSSSRGMGSSSTWRPSPRTSGRIPSSTSRTTLQRRV
jgi:hypothetical protein